MLTVVAIILCVFIIIAIILFGFIYLYFIHIYNYWEKLKIPFFKPTFPYGNICESAKAKKPVGENITDLYQDFKKTGQKYGGFFFFHKPSLLIICPKLIKTVLVSDFEYFVDRGFHIDEENDPLTSHLFFLRGQRWKNQRVKLTPVFTSDKLKKMFGTLLNCSLELKNCLDEYVKQNKPVVIKRILLQYSFDIIGSCAFGIECNSFKYPDTEFIKTSEYIFKLSPIDRIKFFFAFSCSSLATFFKLRVTNKHVDIFYRNLVKEIVDYREKYNITRNDFMDLLIQLKNKGYLDHDVSNENKSEENSHKLTLNELTAQAFLFFAAGHETSSTTMNWCFFELSQNQEIQIRLRQEVLLVLQQYNGNITYEALKAMKYMDCVINEILRKYPPFMLLFRVVTKNYILPNTNTELKKGTFVWIPVLGIHRDPEFYPNPEIFDPDRFNEENKKNRTDYTFLPFGEGPRICFGSRFARMQIKVALCQLLTNYKFTLNNLTKLPILFNPLGVVTMPKYDIYLNVEKYTG